MKNIFYILALFIFVFSCKNEEKQNIISADPSAKIRKTPHQNGEELLTLNKGTAIEIIGISSHKDKITIAGKEIEDYWYLIKNNFQNYNESNPMWIFGGCANVDKKAIAKHLSTEKLQTLSGKTIKIAPCFEMFDENGEPSCGTDCDVGDIVFLDDTKCIFSTFCIGNSTDYYSGNYRIKDYKLEIELNNDYVEIPEPEEDSENQDKTPRLKINSIKQKLNFEIHFWNKTFVFFPVSEKDFFGSSPKKSLVIEKNLKKIYEMLMFFNFHKSLIYK